MPDDEPLDDARQVATIAAATAARVVETLAREVAQHRTQLAQQQERAQLALAQTGARWDSPEQRQQRNADLTAAGVPDDAREARMVSDQMNTTRPGRADLHNPDTWHKTGGDTMTEAQAYTLAKMNIGLDGLTKADASKVIGHTNGNPAELAQALKVKNTANAMNGTHPTASTTAGVTIPAASQPAVRTQPRTSRGR